MKKKRIIIIVIVVILYTIAVAAITLKAQKDIVRHRTNSAINAIIKKGENRIDNAVEQRSLDDEALNKVKEQIKENIKNLNITSN